MTYEQDKREYDANNWFEVKDNPRCSSLSHPGLLHSTLQQVAFASSL